ncbi:hypothetical protein LY76DRAFT_271163 [Colletotrichum caudatum]|nr:hypothetical protein LY76DRAFT_271163 [Colletotrichum caudatum]
MGFLLRSTIHDAIMQRQGPSCLLWHSSIGLLVFAIKAAARSLAFTCQYAFLQLLSRALLAGSRCLRDRTANFPLPSQI